MPRHHFQHVLLILAAATMAACNDTAAPEPVRLDDVLADAASVEGYASAGTVAGGAPMLPSHGVSAGSCTFTAASQSFVCPTVTRGNMTVSRSFQLLDASNTPQSAFDPATTAAVKTIVDMSGTTTGERFTSSIQHHSEQTVGGLLGNTRSVDGTSTSRFIMVSGTATDTMNTSTTTHLTMPRPSQSTQRVYPTGTVTTVMSRSGIRGSAMTMTTTFNGTSIATLTTTVGGVSRTCTIDLAQRSRGTCFTVGVRTL